MYKVIAEIVGKDRLIKFTVLILLALITYAQYFMVIPMKGEVIRNRRKIAEVELLIEKYQVRNNVMFENITFRIEGLSKHR